MMIKKNIIGALFALFALSNFAIAQTLDEVLAITYENNHELKSKREDLKVADEEIMLALSTFLPQINAGRSISDSDSKPVASQGQSPPIAQSRSQIASAIVIKQNLFNSGGSIAGIRRAKYTIEQARATLLYYEQQILLSAVESYLGVAKAQMQLDIYEKKVIALRKSLEAEEARYKVGEKTKTDVAQARSSYSNSIAARIKARGDLVSAKANFFSVVTVEPEHVKLPLVSMSVPQSVDEATDIALKKNPVLIASEQKYKAADQSIEVERTSLLPSVDLSYTWRKNSGDIGSPDSIDNITALTLNVPVFNSSQWSKLRLSKRTAQSSKYVALRSKQEIIEKAVQSWQNYEISKAAMHAYEDAVKSAEIAYEGMKEEEKAGTRSTVDVIFAQNGYFDADINLVSAKVTNISTRYKLKSAIGELTAKELALKVKFYDPLQNYNKIRWELIGAF